MKPFLLFTENILFKVVKTVSINYEKFYFENVRRWDMNTKNKGEFSEEQPSEIKAAEKKLFSGHSVNLILFIIVQGIFTGYTN